MASFGFLNTIFELLFKGFKPTPSEITSYVFPPTTKQNLEYADLAIVDLSKMSTPEGRKELTAQLSKAMHETGFFYIINHGYTQEQTNRVFGIANLIFDNVSEDEKKLYTGQSSSVYEGYKPKQTWQIQEGVRDQIEHYNINHQVDRRPHPEAVRPYLKEIQDFAYHNHHNILFPVLRLLAAGLELPEDTFVKQHLWDAAGESSVRFMKYHPRTAEEEEKTKNVMLKGHTDIGSVTILWSQPIGGLQILSPDGKWRWVKHIDNALVINAGDVMDFLAGGFYPPTRHRVIQPPTDQRHLPRLGAFYFAMANDDVKLVPHDESPVLQRVGIKRLCSNEEAPTMEHWRKGRTTAYGNSLLRPGKEINVEEEQIHGVTVKHWN
ncbi:Clavaminate synthase-like protein [Dendrothele bispora CBS 962.96]|uniref:Clavaminate synthase-like protein n=1 Tax=Dendrothele bispora (strain CBS 962.96) TaxID=1314807 RepID=A0A4S8M750_DENBC|nr:Clavaminate synthase-like protein [Dendrothele bispora CBS 962.96]